PREKVTRISSNKALESEIAELQTEIDERRKERARASPINDIIEHLLRINDHASIKLKTEEECKTSFYSVKMKAQRQMMILEVYQDTILQGYQPISIRYWWTPLKTLYALGERLASFATNSSISGQSETSLSYLPYGMYSNNVPILNNDEGFVLPLHKEIWRLIRQWGNTGAGKIDDGMEINELVAALRGSTNENIAGLLIKPDQYQASPDTHAMSDSFDDATDFSESTPRTPPCPYHPFPLSYPSNSQIWTLKTPPVRVGRQVDRPLEANAVSSWSMDNLTNNNPVRTIEHQTNWDRALQTSIADMLSVHDEVGFVG
ncbi:1476_t:CDS:2, partial [Paraglomus brasilianum]